MEINSVTSSIKNGNYRISDHAFEEMNSDELELEDVLFSVETGEVIESYPKSKITPSCLINGVDKNKNPIHSVWGYFKEKLFSVLITVYIPTRSEWTNNFKTRRIK